MITEQKSEQMQKQTRLITCVLYCGGGDKVLQALHKRGFNTTSLSKGRGSAIGDPADAKGRSLQFEKEIITVVVEADQVEEIMEHIFDIAEIDRPYGGFLYVEKLYRSVPYVLPDLPDEK